jgi:hypothetical protein
MEGNEKKKKKAIIHFNIGIIECVIIQNPTQRMQSYINQIFSSLLSTAEVTNHFKPGKTILKQYEICLKISLL